MNNNIQFIEKLCQEIEASARDIAPDHKAYTDILMALANDLGEQGRQYAHRICRYWSQKEGYLPERVDKDYDYALRSATGGNGLGTVYHYFEQAGLTLPKTYGRANAEKKARRKARTEAKEKETKNVLQEAEKFLQTQASYRRNSLSGKIELLWKEGCMPEGMSQSAGHWMELTDPMLNTLWARTVKACGKVIKNDLHSLINSEFCQDYNPVTLYLQGLQPWHEGDTDHLKALADRVTLADETPEKRLYLELCIKKWFVSTLAGWLLPSERNEYILTFVSEEQGTYKTTFMENLLPPQLMDYYKPNFSFSKIDKDSYIAMANNLIINVDDIKQIHKSNLADLKNLTSLESVNERNPYDRNARKRPRIAAFCGTGNMLNFLVDDTGERRWLCFHVKSIVSPHPAYDSPIDHAALYAQVHALLQAGYPYKFTKQEMQLINQHNQEFKEVDVVEELILSDLRIPLPTDDVKRFTATEIANYLNKSYKAIIRVQDVGRTLIRLGFQSKKSNGMKTYFVHILTPDEQKNIHHVDKTYPPLLDDSDEDDSDKPF